MLKKARKSEFGPVFMLVKEDRLGLQFHSSVEVFEALKDDAQSDREWLQAIYMDPKNQVIQKCLESFGTTDQSAVYPREIARRALLCGASAVILAHNHPSGDPEPSLCDRELTKDMVLGLGTLQIKVLDHIIVGAKIRGNQRYYSFADEGVMDDYTMLMDGRRL